MTIKWDVPITVEKEFYAHRGEWYWTAQIGGRPDEWPEGVYGYPLGRSLVSEADAVSDLVRRVRSEYGVRISPMGRVYAAQSDGGPDK
jgi:hypothetical protein